MHYKGIATLLAESFSSNLTEMLLNEGALITRARKLRTRFSTELILSSIMRLDKEVVDGEITHIERRVLLVAEVGITLAVLFVLAFFYTLFLLRLTTTSRRPLNLQADPSSVLGQYLCLKQFHHSRPQYEM
jgi:hypothetical protein